MNVCLQVLFADILFGFAISWLQYSSGSGYSFFKLALTYISFTGQDLASLN